MATFDPTGASFGSVTWEEALLYLASHAFKAFQAGKAPTGTTMTKTYSAATGNVSIAATLPISASSGASGITLQAAPATDTSFDITPPTDASISVADIFAALMETAKKVNSLEISQATTPNRVALTFNLDAMTSSVNLTLPTDSTPTDQGFELSAIDFLA